MRYLFATLAFAVVIGAPVPSPAQAPAAFDQIKGLSFEQAKEQTLASLKQMKKDDPATLKKVDEIWNPVVDRPLLDRVVDTFVLVDVDVADVVQTARDPQAPALTEVPDVIRDKSRPAFLRDHVALYIAKQLSLRKVHEQMMETIKEIGSPEQTVDPATYYFCKAVAEHKLQNKDEAQRSIHRLLNSVADVPERYQVLAKLMKMEMDGWKNNDLNYVARLMEDAARRLELARAKLPTQAKEEEAIKHLAKMIEEMEKQKNGQPGPGSGPPGQGPNNQIKPNKPADAPYIGGPKGQGKTDKELQKVMELWGKLPEKEKAKALEQIKQKFPPEYQEAIDEFAKLNNGHR